MARLVQSLPDEEFDLIVSALSIHHLETERKQELFRRIYDKLPNGAWFINYDQFCADTPEMSKMFDSCWMERLQQSGLSETEFSLWRERRKLDRECSLNAEIAMLKKCGFSGVNCIYSNQKFSVVAAKK